MAPPKRTAAQKELDRQIGSRLGARARGGFQGGVTGLFGKLKDRKDRVAGISDVKELYRKLRGEDPISRDLLSAICDVLRVNPGWALTGFGEPDLPPKAKMLSRPDETELNAQLSASDRAHWRARFTHAMSAIAFDEPRARQLGVAAADAALAELRPNDPRRQTKLEVLVRFASRISHPGLAGARRTAPTTAAAARVLNGLDDLFASIGDVLPWGTAANATRGRGYLYARLCEDVLASMIGLLVAERADNHRGRPISAHP